MTSPSPAYVEGATVLSQERLTDDVYRLTVATTTGGTPGQFYMVRAWDREPLLARPISIHSMDEDTVSFLYQVRGWGTDLLARLDEGGEVALTGPLGHGFRTAELHGKIAIVTGGIGIAPMFCLARTLPAGDVTVIAGFRSTPYAVAQLLNVGVDVRVATEDGCDGTRGFCTEIFDPHAYDTVVTCGPMPMMARVAPVSYTHLRAHETRHDLVCRLLLEKKKNKKKKKSINKQHKKKKKKKKKKQKKK